MTDHRDYGVVFDLWNTLVYDSASPNPVVWMAERLGIADRPDWTDYLEQAYMTERVSGVEEAVGRLTNLLGLPAVDPKPFVEVFQRAARSLRLFDDVLSTLGALRPRYRLALLTNTQSFHMGFMEQTGLAELFDVRCYSYECGLIKPDPRIFQWTAERLGLPPERLTMVGDNLAKDVLVAEAAGWQGVLIKRSKGFLSHTESTDFPRTIRGLDELHPFLND